MLCAVASACCPRRSSVAAQAAQHKETPISTRAQAPPFRAPIPPEQRVADFRFWHDEKRFRGSGDESLAQHTLLAAGGIRMGGNPKTAAVQGPMGWQVADSWDILWSTSDGAHKAAPLIKPQAGQLINALPGLESLTRKRNLALTLQSAYGDTAWQFVPRSYSLPSQLVQWRQRLADEAEHLATSSTTVAGSTDAPDSSSSSSSSSSVSEPAAAAAAAAAAGAAADIGPVTGWWALKTGQHLGQGLEVVPSSKALSSVLERNAPHIKAAAAAAAASAAGRGVGQQQQQAAASSSSAQQENQPAASTSSSSSSSTDSSDDAPSSISTAAGTTDVQTSPRPFISVQQYITQPLLINNCKFGLRVWVLVVGPKPYRAFVYQQGLVLFSSQPYNPDLSVVQAEGAASQGHLTNAALWGPEKHQHSSSSRSNGRPNPGSSSSSSSSSIDPAQQPVWSLQQLFNVLGQKQAEAVWQQILDTAGKIVSAGAKPVADAAKALSWDGDAAFELLGLDFLLDSSYKSWLLEVNASPSMAWNTPDQPGATQLMYSTKQQMLTDMFALLRLQDRYPAAAAEGTVSDAAAAAAAAAAGAAGASIPRLPAAHGINPVLLQAASKAYFSSRPQVAEMVLQDAQQLAAAVAGAPTRQAVEAAIVVCLQRLEQQGGQQQQQRQRVVAVLRQHLQQLVQVECELQSCGGWQTLLPHMPGSREASQQGWHLHGSAADSAVSSWLRLRQMLVPGADSTA